MSAQRPRNGSYEGANSMGSLAGVLPTGELSPLTGVGSGAEACYAADASGRNTRTVGRTSAGRGGSRSAVQPSLPLAGYSPDPCPECGGPLPLRPTPGRPRLTCSDRCRKARGRRLAESHGSAAFTNAALSIVIVWLLVLAAAFLPACGSDYGLHSGHVPPAAPPCWLDSASGFLFCAGPLDHGSAELACQDEGGELADPSAPDDPLGIDPGAWDALSAGAAELGPVVWTGWPPVTPDGWTGCAEWHTDPLSGHASAMPGDCDDRLPFACEVSDGLE